MTFRWQVKAGIAAATIAAACLAAQEDVIRVNVNLVNVIATVRNAKGALVGNLGKDDFEIYDNGVKQEVAFLHRQTERALSIALLLDVSGSTAKDLKYETDAAARFLKALLAEGHPDDAVAFYTFNYDITLRRDFTHDYASLEARMKLLHGEAGTALYDALFFAAQALERRAGRKAIIVLTDGGDTLSKHTLKESLEAAQLADAVIYPIVVTPITNDAGRNVGGENALTFMAQGTGGRTFMPNVNAQLDRAFSDILAELRTQYLLSFYPRSVPLTASRYHTLEVRTASKELRVSARTGYYGESEGAAASPASRNSVSPGKKKLQER